jgi:hypothetical protein
MSAKTDNLKENFKRKAGEKTAIPAKAVDGMAMRGRGKGSVVCMSFRMERSDWRRIHDMALDEGLSMQELVFKGVAGIFKEKGLPPLNGLPSRSRDFVE